MSLTNKPGSDKLSISVETSESLFKAVFDRIQINIILVDPHTYAILDANSIAVDIQDSSKNE